jgi:hypothetical protein
MASDNFFLVPQIVASKKYIDISRDEIERTLNDEGGEVDYDWEEMGTTATTLNVEDGQTTAAPTYNVVIPDEQEYPREKLELTCPPEISPSKM